MDPMPDFHRPPAFHRPPRHPHAWAWLFAASQLAVVAIWWQWGWMAGLAALLASHLALVWATLRPQSRLLSPVLTRLPTTEPVVWLTIDDGPSDDTRAMLDLLDARNARATFFLVGDRAQARPELVAEIARRGHGIGQHSHTHPQARFWALPPKAMRAQIDDAQAALTQLAGAPPHWFRAVVGMANPFVASALKHHGLARVAWSARGFDAVLKEPAGVAARIERDLAPGAIVLLHEGARHGRNVETLAAVLDRLQQRGYRTVLPEQLGQSAGDDQPVVERRTPAQ
ncbi:polysaccharide deacetylase family protein [Lysobacter sp. GCM10012299]|uniref:polysaccharide deacetylase family protein n=1 Tax=Lysobacter sp. GCM10012299 TaxID=3317333 RepID=UPI00361C4856